MVQMALRAAGKPSPSRGYSKRAADLEAPDNVSFRACSTSCVALLCWFLRGRKVLILSVSMNHSTRSSSNHISTCLWMVGSAV